MVFMNDEMPGMSRGAPSADAPVPVTMWLYVPDTDAAFKRAVDAGAKPLMPPADMFWGDRFAKVIDPFGHHWGIATHKEDLTPAQMDVRRKEWEKQMAQQPPQK